MDGWMDGLHTLRTHYLTDTPLYVPVGDVGH